MTAVMSSSVAEKALCWCEGRNKRSRRAKPRHGCASGESAEFAIKGRFYTQTFGSPDTPNGSCGADTPVRRLCGCCLIGMLFFRGQSPGFVNILESSGGEECPPHTFSFNLLLDAKPACPCKPLRPSLQNQHAPERARRPGDRHSPR